MLPGEIEQLFNKYRIDYELVRINPTLPFSKAVVELGIDPDQVAVSNMLTDKKEQLLVIYPLNKTLDLQSLNEKLRRKFILVPASELQLEWPTYCGKCLPLAKVYRLQAEVYEDFANGRAVYFQTGKTELCRVSSTDFCKMQGSAMYDNFFLRETDGSLEIEDNGNVASRRDMIRERLQSINSLPAMPSMAQRLLRLNMRKTTSARELAAVVEQDPSLCSQLIRLARSPLYYYKGEINSVKDVISRVLGYDLVMDMALGVSVGKAFRNARKGRLGLHEYWRHSIYCAVLCERLARAVNMTEKPEPAMAYLCGLLHNFGFLLLGHLYPGDFRALNRAVTSYPDSSVIDLEHTMIGVTHMEMGAWLMQAWDLPEEIVVVVREHHNEYYRDSHSEYVKLVMIANRMLAELELGDENDHSIPSSLLSSLNIDEAMIDSIYQEILGSSQGLDYIAQQLAA